MENVEVHVKADNVEEARALMRAALASTCTRDGWRRSTAARATAIGSSTAR